MRFFMVLLSIAFAHSLALIYEHPRKDTSQVWNNWIDQFSTRNDALTARAIEIHSRHQGLSINEFWNTLENRDTSTQSTKLLRRVAGRSRSGSPVGAGKDAANMWETTNLFIIPYYRGHHPRGGLLPYHWAILAADSPADKGTVYQLRGLPGQFRYPGPERSISVEHSRRKRQELSIGKIPTSKIGEMEGIIAQTPISTSKVGYNCQNWVENVLEGMYQRQWLYYQPRTIVTLMKQMET